MIGKLNEINKKGGVLMAQKKYYAVVKGRKTGVFDNWDVCKKQIEGYSGAIYKGFLNYEDAYNFINGQAKNINNIEDNIHKIEAYVDGSYSEEYGKYSYGCIILFENEIIKLSGASDDKDYIAMRNVAGELLGAMEAIKWAYENKLNSITIYYDYEGIEKWANEIWKTNRKGTKEYLEFIKKYRKCLTINFKKVKAHSGDVYNEEADKLAKDALFGDIKGMQSEKKILDKNIEIFNRIMNIEDKTKNSFNFLFKNYIISESKLKKFVKEIWELHGNDRKEIDIINLNFDIKNSRLQWSVKNTQGNQQDFEIYI